MLTELYIRDFAIIDELRMHFARGFTVLTGETGAGKSIILDAFSLVLGGRADSTMVRAGSEQAYVEAAFALGTAQQALIAPLLRQEGLEDEQDDVLLLARELRANGRSIARVNGRSVNLSLLREVAEPLVDIHGQGEHLSLLKPAAHLPLLDSYAGLVEEREAFAAEVDRLRGVERELAALRRDERQLAQRVDMLTYQAREIAAAELVPGEDGELREERTRLSNAEQLALLATEATVALAGLGEGDEVTAADLLGRAERALSHLVRLDPAKGELLETLQGLSFQLSEVARALHAYQNQLEFNPQRLNEVEERLELINNLKRKYGESIEEVLAAGERAGAELEQISHSEERTAELEQLQERLLRRIGELGLALSERRQEAARALAAAVEKQLDELQMAGVQFAVQFSREQAATGAYAGEERYAFDRSGLDTAEFVISTNPGEPLKPVARVASGGETARLMLALKTALAEVDATPTLIFDEIDQGIGGRVGAVVGQKLWGLTAAGGHQVVVVTHLPQLAGFGDVHYHVSKHVVRDRTKTIVDNLDLSGRIAELAAMLGTSGETAAGGAKSILSQVESVKSRRH